VKEKALGVFIGHTTNPTCGLWGRTCKIGGKNNSLFPAAVWLAVETTLQQEPTMHSDYAIMQLCKGTAF
jgi:hypothetical protein